MRTIFVIILNIYYFIYLKPILIEQFKNSINGIRREPYNLFLDDLCLVYSQNQNQLTINYYNKSESIFNTFSKDDGEFMSEGIKNYNISNGLIIYHPNNNKIFLNIFFSSNVVMEINAYYENEIVHIQKAFDFPKFTFLEDNTLILYSNSQVSKYNPSLKEEVYFEKSSMHNIIYCLGLSDSFALVKKDYSKKEYLLEIRDKDFSLITDSKIYIEDDYYEFYLSYIDYNDKNIFLLCYKNSFETCINCAPIKLKQNKLKIGKYIEIANNTFGYNLITGLSILENNKLAFSYVDAFSESIYLSIIIYSNGELKPGEYFKTKILGAPNKNYKYCIYESPFLYNFKQKGLVLYYLLGNYTDTFYFKYYFNASCDSFDYTIREINQKQYLSFDNHLTGGQEKEIEFQILKFDNNVKIYKDNKLIKPGKDKYKQNQVFEIQMSYINKKNQKIEFTIPYLAYKCHVNLNYKKNIIKILEREELCIKKEKAVLNDIIEHNLNEKKMENAVEFYIKFKYEVTDNELYYIYKGKKFKCQKKDKVYAICNPKLKIKNNNEFDIYGELSCQAPIFIGTLKIGDPYIIETYEVPNMDNLTRNFNKNYDAKQKIEKFDINMISYYYWFASFTYCSDENKKVHDKYLNDWKIIDQHQIIQTDNLFYSAYFNDLRSELLIDEDEKELYKLITIESVNVKYIIYKNDNFKKYVISFSGYDPARYFIQALTSRKVNYLNHKYIEINKFFLEQFESIESFLFSEKFMTDIKNNLDYQIIFIGHSFGGAMATLSVYAFVKKYLNNYGLTSINPVLITFGQPRIGNEFFAKDFTKSIPNIYRISHIQDYMTMLPLRKRIEELKLPDIVEGLKKVISGIFKEKDLFQNFEKYRNILAGLILTGIICISANIVVVECLKLIFIDVIVPKAIKKLSEEVFSFFLKRIFEVAFPFGYCHIGGLYMIDENRKTFNHCIDFFNKKTNHYLCDNFAELNDNYDQMLPDMLLNNRQYFTEKQDIVEKCNKMINK